MGKTIIAPQQRARIISFRGRMSSSEVAHKEGCLRDTVKKIWSRYAKETGAKPLLEPHVFRHGLTSTVTGQVIRDYQRIEPLIEPLIDHGPRLIELKECQCSWPLHGRDEDGRLRFCGAPRHRSKISPFYCEQHVEMARGPAGNTYSERQVEYLTNYIAEHHTRGPQADDLLLDELAEAA